jgi:hypothetical protein
MDEATHTNLISSLCFITRRNHIQADLLRLGHTHPLAVEAISGGIAVIGGVIHAHHATDAVNPAGSTARLFEFALSPGTGHALSGTLKAVFGRVALVAGIINARQALRALNYAGAATR